jgi:hypothetical protein
MGVHHGQGGVFLGQVLKGAHQHGVLEHVGMVASVKGVSVTEHGVYGSGWHTPREFV